MTVRLATVEIPVYSKPFAIQRDPMAMEILEGQYEIDRVAPGEVLEVKILTEGDVDPASGEAYTEDMRNNFYHVTVQNMTGYIRKIAHRTDVNDADAEDMVDIPKAIVITVFDDIHEERLMSAEKV